MALSGGISTVATYSVPEGKPPRRAASLLVAAAQLVAMLVVILALAFVSFILSISAETATPRPSDMMLTVNRVVSLVGLTLVLVTTCVAIFEPRRRKAAAVSIALFALCLFVLGLAFIEQQG